MQGNRIKGLKARARRQENNNSPRELGRRNNTFNFVAFLYLGPAERGGLSILSVKTYVYLNSLVLRVFDISSEQKHTTRCRSAIGRRGTV
jgi:hypothetical protein